MRKTIAMQSIVRSQLDRSRICGFDEELVTAPTKPLIHMDARLLFFRDGKGVIRLQGADYPVEAGSVAAILPWQVSEIVSVAQPLQYSLIAYHFDTVSGAARLFPGPGGEPLPLQERMETAPVVLFTGEALSEAERIVAALRNELGLESAPKTAVSRPWSAIRTVSLLTELLVLFLRGDALEASAAGRSPEGREMLRYMYLHCNRKLTLAELAGVFYCSRATASACITSLTGLSFFDLLNEMRIGKTANYLMYTDMTLKELAEVLGYVDESHISKVFAARLGTKIGDYRKTYQNVENILGVEQNRLGYSIVNCVYRNYASDLTAKEVAHMFGITAQKLNAVLLSQVEKNYEEFLNAVRVDRASELLLTTKQSALDIALEVGYRSVKTFTRNFIKRRGMTPREYRRCLKNGGEEPRGAGSDQKEE